MNNFYLKFLSTLIFLIGCSLMLSAQTTYVNASASGANTGASWTDAYTDLSVALANTNSGDLWVASGIYKPGEGSADSSSTFYINNALAVYGGFDGTETSIDDRDVAANATILSGDINDDDVEDDFENNKGDNVQHVIFIDSLISGVVVVDGFRITGAHTSDNNDLNEFFWRGGGIISYSTVEVRNSDFYGNFARSGAGIYVNGTTSAGADNSKFENCTFEHSYTSSQSAGIFLNTVNNAVVSECTFQDNVTNRGAFYPLLCDGIEMSKCNFIRNEGEFPDGFGGAMFNWQSVGWVVSECTFEENSGGNGGVMYHDGREAALDKDNLKFVDCTFRNNTSSDFGGGVFYSFDASFTFEACNFFGNEGTNGAHLFITGSNKDVLIKDCTFENGTAQFGGAHSCYGANSTFLLDGNTYTGNSATTSGGALIIGFQADVKLNNCRFIENTGNFGGAIYAQNDSTFIDYAGCEFNANMSSGGGGAIYKAGGIETTMDNCNFFVNTAVTDGGAMFIATINDDAVRGSLNVKNTSFSFNQAGANGGAVALVDIDTDITSSLFANNLSTGTDAIGGAIFSESTDSNAVTNTFINNTVVNNECISGTGFGLSEGAVESSLVTNFQNNMIFNTSPNVSIGVGEPEANSNGGNLLADDSQADVFMDATDQLSVADPLFVDQLNLDLHLQANSPAVDAGVSAGAPATDIEGNSRIGETDAGAYEYDPTSTKYPFADNSALVILPNPVAKNLSYEFTETYAGLVNMSIYNSNGQLINNWEGTKSSAVFRDNIAVSHLAPGSYRLFLRFGKFAVVQHFVKQ